MTDKETLVNEYDPELLSIHALNPFAQHNSSPRNTMFSSHFSQRPVIKCPTEKRIQTGLEYKLKDSTFSIKMPENGIILDVIDRYPKGNNINSLPFNPEKIVIYEYNDTKEIGCFTIPYYCSHHTYFGFRYKFTDEINDLYPGKYIKKGVIFADTPSSLEETGYMYGVELNVAYMTHPAIAEDGIIICEDVLDKLSINVFENRAVEFGNNSFPLNLYGDIDNYKPFPEIGDYIRDDGILMATRSFEEDIFPVETSTIDILEVDYTFDKCTYVRGPGGKIVDIKVYSDSDIDHSSNPFNTYIDKYRDALIKFNLRILESYKKIIKDREKRFGNSNISIKPEFNRYIKDAMALTYKLDSNDRKGKKITYIYREIPIEAYRIEFVIEYEIKPDIGFKITDCHGSKGVICYIEKPENMPLDSDGNRADIIQDSLSIAHRSNPGKLYEHYIGSAARDISKKVKNILKVNSKEGLNQIQNLDQNIIDYAYNYILGFFKLVSKKQYLFYKDQVLGEDRLKYLADVIDRGIYIYYPSDNQYEPINIIKNIQKEYPPVYGPVTYTGYSGDKVTTLSNIRIGPMYIMLLEKIADDWSCVSSGTLNVHGVLSPTTKSEKYRYPYRNTSIKSVGESEGRIINGFCENETIAEMFDRNGNILVHKHIYKGILESNNPTNINDSVNREIYPLGSTKALQLYKHITMCSGYMPVYEPEELKK